MKHCLIFDLDGTLVDSLPGISASLNRSLIAHGLPGHSDAAVRGFVGDGLRMLVQRAVYSGAEPTLIESVIAFFKKDYEVSWQHGTIAYPGIHELLESLQYTGDALAVLSNKTHDFTVAMVSRLFPDISFAMVLGQRDGTPHKPDPYGAVQIATIAETSPQHCVMIGDSTIDIETATHAGMQSIAVTWGYHDREKLSAVGARTFINHPSEFTHALEQLHFC